MSSKVFQETDSWGDPSGHSNSFDFSLHKTPEAAKSKKVKKAKKRRHSEIEEEQGEVGRYVRPPNYYNKNVGEDSEDEVDLLPEKFDKKSLKRKHEKVEALNCQSSDGITPEKKSKPKMKVPESSSSFGAKLRESLKGSRFRFINEQMYTQSGKESFDIFKEDPTAFEAYHEGYRHQIAKWPLNPLDRIINGIKRLPKDHVVVDMGCGEARLASSVVQKVYSIDLVSNVEGVIESDMAKTPLETKSAHAVVYCLSLMGTNLKDFFIEANRILKLNGLVKIAEVTSRFDNVEKFIDSVQQCGFELVSKDLTDKLFYFLNFKKTHDVNKFNKKIPDFSLNPCLYKKR